MFHRKYCITFLMLLTIPCFDTQVATRSIWYKPQPVADWIKDVFKPPIDEASLLPPIEQIQNCQDCPRIHMPVCANNKQTYTNICYMNCAAKVKRKSIRMVFAGHCHMWPEAYEDEAYQI